jgi:tRNA-dihydrouridine synthase B
MPFSIGPYDFDRPILLAPMEDVTDMPFRLVCKRLGADIVYTEFVNAEGLIRESAKTRKKMVFTEAERPFGIQIYGGVEESMEQAARLSEEVQPDLIDINCGCWVKDIAMRGAGAGLLKDIPKMGRLVDRVIRAVRLPVTVKTRLGWDAESIKIVEVAQMLEDLGVKALTVHCRTRAQGHKGDADYSWIPKVKSAVRMPIIVNGGINTAQDAERVYRETGADGIMIARAAITNPWIFREIKHYLATGRLLPGPSIDERFEQILDHMRMAVEFKGERKAVLEYRKHYSGYLHGLPHASKVRQDLMVPETYAGVEGILLRYRSFLHSLPQEPVSATT